MPRHWLRHTRELFGWLMTVIFPADSILLSQAELEPSDSQYPGNLVSHLLEVKTKSGASTRFDKQIELGDWNVAPPNDAVKQTSKLLAELKDGIGLE